jgi:hypothetical protein
VRQAIDEALGLAVGARDYKFSRNSMDSVVTDFPKFGTGHTKSGTVHIKFGTTHLKFDIKIRFGHV